MGKNALILVTVYTLLLMLGGVIFMYLEYEVVPKTTITEPDQWKALKGLVQSTSPPQDEDELTVLVGWLEMTCDNVTQEHIQAIQTTGVQDAVVTEVESVCPHLHQEDIEEEVVFPWSFIDAVYFSMTVATTIGYGHISPSQTGGRLACMIYAIVSIPLTGILLAWSSDYLGEKLFELFKSKLDEERQQNKRIIILATVLYILFGFVVFIFIPALIFMYIEPWSYFEGVYYSFITLTTIGFGDFVTGNDVTGVWKYVYQIGVILWIMAGLGYWIMVANFITKAIKSKKVKETLQKMKEMTQLMQKMGVKNHDPAFLRLHSKATINFMIQLSNIIAIQADIPTPTITMPGDDPDSPTSIDVPPSSPGALSNVTTDSGVSENNSKSPMSSKPSTPSKPSSPVRPGINGQIPGIAALFGPAMSRTNPLSQLMGPLVAPYFHEQQKKWRNSKNPTSSSVPTEKESKTSYTNADIDVIQESEITDYLSNNETKPTSKKRYPDLKLDISSSGNEYKLVRRNSLGSSNISTLLQFSPTQSPIAPQGLPDSPTSPTSSTSPISPTSPLSTTNLIPPEHIVTIIPPQRSSVFRKTYPIPYVEHVNSENNASSN